MGPKITVLYEKIPFDMKDVMKQLFIYLKFFFYLQSHSIDLSLAKSAHCARNRS